MTGMMAVLDCTQIVGRADDALGQQELRGQRPIVPGSAHDHGERFPVQPNLERLLDGGRVVPAAGRARRESPELAGTWCGWIVRHDFAAAVRADVDRGRLAGEIRDAMHANVVRRSVTGNQTSGTRPRRYSSMQSSSSCLDSRHDFLQVSGHVHQYVRVPRRRRDP
jgi:hypothetical protein